MHETSYMEYSTYALVYYISTIDDLRKRICEEKWVRTRMRGRPKDDEIHTKGMG